MIVTDQNVEAALAFLADADAAGEAIYKMTKAENRSKQTFARLYLSYSGPVEERKARALCNPEAMEMADQEAEASRDLERYKARRKEAEMLIELYRTEAANARAAERIR